MSHDVFVCGVGMIPFTKPGANEPYPQMAAHATRAALADAGIGYEQVQQAYVGYVFGDSTSGQRAVYEVGMTGIPVVNVNNNCSTGSTALFLARQVVASGAADCAQSLFQRVVVQRQVDGQRDRALDGQASTDSRAGPYRRQDLSLYGRRAAGCARDAADRIACDADAYGI